MLEGRDMGKLLTTVRAARLRELALLAVSWWCGEFVNLLPQRMAAPLTSGGRPRIVVNGCASGVTARLIDPGSGIDVSETSDEAGVMAVIEAIMKRYGLDRRDVDLGLRLPEQDVFRRDIVLPSEARDSIDTIVPQDLLRRTPFKMQDIYSDHVAGASPDGRVAVRQWVTRRGRVQQATDELGLPVEQIAFAVFGDDEGAPSIRLARKAEVRNSYRIAIAALCCTTILLGAGLAGMTYARQQTALDRLEADIAIARRNAERVRSVVDQLRERQTALVRLRLQRSESPGLIDVWDETTRLLPKHSWLTELRLIEGGGSRSATVALTGFSAAAPSLVSILDRSKFFIDATLTSPVAMDPIEGRERFSLQVKIRLPDALKEAAQ